MKNIFLLLTTFSILFANKIDESSIHYGIRGEKIRAWIYLTDKLGSEKIQLSEKAIQRREKSGVFSNNLWSDYLVSQNYINAINGLNIKIVNKSRWLNAVSVLCTIEQLREVSEFHFVEKITPVIGYKKSTLTVHETEMPSQRDYDYGVAQPQIEQINVHELHNEGYTGEGVRILVMDTGFDLSHPSFSDINVIDQWDFLNNDGETANETSDEENVGQHHHGTAVLSTIAGVDPGEFMGVAFDAEFLLAKTESVPDEFQGEEDNYVAGLEWGEANGADVVSTSLGYLDWYTYEDMDGNTAVTTNAVDIAVGLGMVCVTAAGNSGNSSWYYIIAPADADSVIAVGAVRENDQIASFSSHGPTYDGRIKPEVCARGSYTWCVNSYVTSGYSQMSGTSLACPLVGGAVALIRQAQPEWSAMDIRNAIIMTASQSEMPDNSYGYGIMDAYAAANYTLNVTDEPSASIPILIQISSIYPNPFNPKVSIEIQTQSGQYITVDVLSIEGAHIETLFDGHSIQSKQKLIWSPNGVASGIYVIKASSGKTTHFQKITYIK